MTKRSLLNLITPKEKLDSVLSITPEFLRERNLEGLILDLDNTLVPHGPRTIPTLALRHNLKNWLQILTDNGIKIHIVSNGLPNRVQSWAKKLGIPGISSAGKPFRRNLRKACSEMKLLPNKVAVVGDQLFTDVLGGNRLGAYTILVTPLTDHAYIHTRITRLLEKIAIWQIKRTNGHF